MREPYSVESEKEADIFTAHLQKRNFVLPSRGERGSRLGIEPKEGLPLEELHSSLSVALADDDLYMPRKEHSGQVCEKLFIVFVKYLFQCLLSI